MTKNTKSVQVEQVPKRRGRPPKDALIMTLDKPKRGRKPKAEAVDLGVDWEKLSKQLQEALESSIEENKVLFKDNSLLVKDNTRLLAIVAYLESRLARANNSI